MSLPERKIEVEFTKEQLELISGVIGAIESGAFTGFHITRRGSLTAIATVLNKARLDEFAKVIASPEGGIIPGTIAAKQEAGKDK